MKVAIVHEWLAGLGGSEKVMKAIHDIFPEAPVYTFVYNEKNMPDEYKSMDIRTSYLQKIPFAKQKYQLLLNFMPTAVEQYDLSEYDVVISSSTCCAKGVLTKSNTLHICYCHTPMRYAWDLYHEYIADKNKLLRMYIAYSMNRIRIWDRISADRVDYFIANSKYVANRIEKTYRRNSKVIYPPVDVDFYTPGNETEDFYLIVSRLVSYKKVELAIEAFNELGLTLIIIGGGPEYKKCKSIAKDNIIFKGKLSNEEVRDYYRRCKAFVFPGEEDFGITPVEAQSCGKPVIAFGKGGTLETIIDGKTGVFFYSQDVKSLKEAVLKVESDYDIFDKQYIREHASKYSINRFKAEFIEFFNQKLKEFNEK
ncbi:D-inositol 3-phosphate glycosyltransferase [Oxobacter pfennigii]|uniref:D-inositol 3-phosphate glycosyltransferase n=1 Tax=Oxobacter pfennigii TaxID=36849 RepID=A0A0N8NT31_9CLOT|nr:glycosyltransferase [Oxobacter pfennigii]KPU43696.1 D-inositol 3-phosphate glycosyltransferase [Oxobacter pfennigii]